MTLPLMEAGTASHRAVMFERTSDLALVVASAISVCLYIRNLAAFLLSGLGIDTPINEHIVTVAVISIVGGTLIVEQGSEPRAIFKKSLTQTPGSDPAVCPKSSRPAFISFSFCWRTLMKGARS